MTRAVTHVTVVSQARCSFQMKVGWQDGVQRQEKDKAVWCSKTWHPQGHIVLVSSSVCLLNDLDAKTETAINIYMVWK